MAVLLSRSCVLLLAAYAAWWALVTTVGMVGHTTDHGDSSPLQPADPPPRKPPTARGMPCGGMVVALTRSVVDPPRRPARLRAIAETWGRELAAHGVRVLLLSNSPHSECPAGVAQWWPHNATGAAPQQQWSLLCVHVAADLASAKFDVFQWLVARLLTNSATVEWLLWANDHTFLVPANLVAFVSSLEAGAEGQRRRPPVFYGGHEFQAGSRRFVSGAAGILLNRPALDMLRHSWAHPADFPFCLPPARRPAVAAEAGSSSSSSSGGSSASSSRSSSSSGGSNPGAEEAATVPALPSRQPRALTPGQQAIRSFGKVKEPGLVLADCLHWWGVLPNSTVNAAGEDRFHPYGPKRMVYGLVDQWYRNYHRFRTNGSLSAVAASAVPCCAPDSLSFHYVEAPECRALFSIVSNQSLYRGLDPQQRHAAWPLPKQLGGYSAALRPQDDLFWLFLLEKLVVRRWKDSTRCQVQQEQER